MQTFADLGPSPVAIAPQAPRKTAPLAPDRAVRALDEIVDHRGRVWKTGIDEMAVAIDRDAGAAAIADPKLALAAYQQNLRKRRSHCRALRRPDFLECDAVEAEQPIGRGKPEIAIGSLRDGYDTTWRTVFLGPTAALEMIGSAGSRRKHR
ncbi:hypothetical protein NUTIK01_01730 [Novosphingobium sp. IK01]|uniref:Uncharacterized protein n=1 Tax=Novosphingobium pituita TaxID=3056842 RepID=A0ABQ6P5I6_9SPHN|nr:hypothetical protein NUTIK01_01730 [Novosphingobium sp. IK01]